MRVQVTAENMQRLAFVVQMTDEAFKEFADTLVERVNLIGASQPFVDVVKDLKHTTPAVGEEVLKAVFPLALGFIADGNSAKDVSSAVVEAISETTDRSILKTSKDLNLLKRRLLSMLSDKALVIKGKALSLAFDRGMLYGESKIISDLRPVFGSKNNDKVEAFTVIHTLAIECSKAAGGLEKFHIALDSRDLAELLKVVQRAMLKEKALSAFVSSTGVLQIDIE